MKIYNSKSEAEEVLEKCINSVEDILTTFDVKMGCDDSFYGKLHAHVDGDLIMFEREKFFKLDDLIHHAFQHVKEQLASK